MHHEELAAQLQVFKADVRRTAIAAGRVIHSTRFLACTLDEVLPIITERTTGGLFACRLTCGTGTPASWKARSKAARAGVPGSDPIHGQRSRSRSVVLQCWPKTTKGWPARTTGTRRSTNNARSSTSALMDALMKSYWTECQQGLRRWCVYPADLRFGVARPARGCDQERAVELGEGDAHVIARMLLAMHWRGMSHPTSFLMPSLHPPTGLLRWMVDTRA